MPLPGSIVVSDSHLSLLSKGGAVLSINVDDGMSSVMEEIEQLFVGA